MADDQDKSQKTEEPTQERLRKAREEGQVPFSREVSHWFILTAFALSLVFFLPYGLERLKNVLAYYVKFAAQVPVGEEHIKDVILRLGVSIFFALSTTFLMFIAAAFASGILQTGLQFTPKSVKPKLSKISPKEGLKRVFGSKALAEFLKGLVKFAIVGFVGFQVMYPEFQKISMLPSLTSRSIVIEIKDVILLLLVVVLSVYFIIAVADYAWQKYQHLKNLRMSKQELKEEFKQMEGDPELKAKVRQIREERARNRMMQEVPDAAVVLMNPVHYAVALKYKLEETAPPQVVAKGEREVAFRIRDIAEENGVPVVRNAPLTRALYKNVPLGTRIPKDYFEAVARVIRYVYGLDTHYRDHLDDDLDPQNLER